MTDQNLTERKSKSQIKREMGELRELGAQLVGLSDSTLKVIPLSEKLLEAVRVAKGFKREARRRQLQYIGVLLRDMDEGAIRWALDNLSRPHREEVQGLHEVERWRDDLVEGDSKLLNDLVGRFKDANRQHLRQLVRNAIKEREQGKTPKSSRTLYRYLFELRSGNRVVHTLFHPDDAK